MSEKVPTSEKIPMEKDPLKKSPRRKSRPEEAEVYEAGNPDTAEGDRHQVDLCLEDQAPAGSETRH